MFSFIECSILVVPSQQSLFAPISNPLLYKEGSLCRRGELNVIIVTIFAYITG
jgi:hypothetical protein